jgi:uncharacterized protein (UPF0335 family)
VAKSRPWNESDLVDETPAPRGHNSIHSESLKKICSELEAIAEQKKILSAAQSDIMQIAKQKGFKGAHIREALKLRAMGIEKREEFLQERDAYFHALGLV